MLGAIVAPTPSLSRTIAAKNTRCAHHDPPLATWPLADHPAAAVVPAHLLSHSVRVCLQDQFRRGGAARPSLHRRHLLYTRSSPAARREPRQLPLPVHRRGVRGGLSVFAAHRLLFHS